MDERTKVLVRAASAASYLLAPNQGETPSPGYAQMLLNYALGSPYVTYADLEKCGLTGWLEGEGPWNTDPAERWEHDTL